MFFHCIRSYLVTACNGRLGMQFFYILPNNGTPNNEIQPRLRFTRAWKLKYIRRFGHRKGRQRGGEAVGFAPGCRPLCLPFLTAVMTDGCVHLLYNSSWKFNQLAAGQLLSGQPVRYGKAGSMDRPSQCKSHLPGHCPPAQLSRAPCRASPPW